MVEKGKSPQMTGFLLTDATDPKARKSIGKVALWENTSLTENAPALRGVVQTEKGKYRIALLVGQGEGGRLVTTSPKTALLIKFNVEGIDTESVRELLEDNLGVQILSIDESEHFDEDK